MNKELLDFDFQKLRNNFIDNYGKDQNGNKNRDDFRKYALMNSLYNNATETGKVQIIQMMQRKNINNVNKGRWEVLSKSGPSFLNDPICLVGLYFLIIFVMIIGFQFKEFSLLSKKSMNPTPGPFLHSLWGWGRRWIRI